MSIKPLSPKVTLLSWRHGESPDAFSRRCSEIAALGIEHIVVIGAGTWTDDAVATVAAAARRCRLELGGAPSACMCPEPLAGASPSRLSASLVAGANRRVRGYWPVEPATTAATLSCPTWVEHAADAALNGTYAAAVFPGG
jgi:hypothetical protein